LRTYLIVGRHLFVVVVVLLCGGCLASAGAPKPLAIPPRAGADPAAVQTPNGVAFIYTTQSGGMNIPAWPFDVVASQASCCLVDALPTPNLPPDATTAHVWAPTVRRIGTNYVLMWSGSPVTGRQPGNRNCIFAAVASTPAGPFNAVTTGSFVHGLCDANKCTGYLDPDLFFDTKSVQYWLYFSKQSYCVTAGTPAGAIVAQHLTADGLTLVGSPALMFTFSDVKNSVATCGLGGSPRLENPAMVSDASNGYDMLVSLGTFSTKCYSTIEIPCLLANGECHPELGSVLKLAGNTKLVGTGGASLLSDAGPDGNFVVFNGWTGAYAGTRYPWGDTIFCVCR
jgi:hypothetical protein